MQEPRHPNLQRRSARHRTGDMAWISAMLDQITTAGRNEPHFPTRSHQSAGTLEVKNEFLVELSWMYCFFHAMSWSDSEWYRWWLKSGVYQLRPGSLSHYLQGFYNSQLIRRIPSIKSAYLLSPSFATKIGVNKKRPTAPQPRRRTPWGIRNHS